MYDAHLYHPKTQVKLGCFRTYLLYNKECIEARHLQVGDKGHERQRAVDAYRYAIIKDTSVLCMYICTYRSLVGHLNETVNQPCGIRADPGNRDTR